MKKTAWWIWVLRIGLFLVAAVISLAALAVAWISFDGRRELAKTKSELLARGEKLSLAELIPPPIPDEQNFYADPMWLELADLVEVESPVGVMKQPRLPSGERLLDALDQPLSEDEIEMMKAKFSDFDLGVREATKTNAVAALLENWELLSPESRRERSEYMESLLSFDQQIIRQIKVLLDRPNARFPLNHEESAFLMGLHHYSYLMKVARRFRAYALVGLELGKNSLAFENVQAIFKVSEKANEPFLISYMMRASILEIGIPIIDAGLKVGAWNAGDLEQLEQVFSNIGMDDALPQALRGERVGFNSFIDDIRAGKIHDYQQHLSGLEVQRPWLWVVLAGDQAMYNQVMQSWIDVAGKASEAGFRKDLFSKSEFQETVRSNAWRYPLTKTVMPIFFGISTRTAVIQTQINQTRIACALERYRLARGEYPVSLEGLVPDFLPEIPRDVVTAQPMRYERLAPDFFRLWSVGSNEIDEGGVPGKTRDTGDWVWGAPIPRL